MPRYDFTAGQILTAAQMDQVSDQTVMTFAGTAARGSAIPSPTEGMVAYINDSNSLTVWDGSAWIPAASGATLGSGTILQVVSTTKTDAFTMSSSTYADVTGLSASITPISATSKIYISALIAGGSTASASALTGRLLRDSTAIAVGDLVGSRIESSFDTIAALSSQMFTNGVQFLDSPATTSAITYKIQVRTNNNGTLVAVNRSVTDTNDSSASRAVSTITLMEVAG